LLKREDVVKTRRRCYNKQSKVGRSKKIIKNGTLSSNPMGMKNRKKNRNVVIVVCNKSRGKGRLN